MNRQCCKPWGSRSVAVEVPPPSPSSRHTWQRRSTMSLRTPNVRDSEKGGRRRDSERRGRGRDSEKGGRGRDSEKGGRGREGGWLRRK